MVISGSLLKGMQKVIDSLAVLVIDEFDRSSETTNYDRFSHYPADHVTAAQQRVIWLSQSYGCPVYFIQYDLDLPVGSYFYNQNSRLSSYWCATKKSLRVLLPPKTRVINKHTANAFTGTSLFQLLSQENQCQGVEHLAVLGLHSNMCVFATVGSVSRFGIYNQSHRGAIDYGFTVHTCQQVLNGDEAIWADNSSRIKFYSHL